MVRAFEQAPERFGQIPERRGVIFICAHCGRPYAVPRDRCLAEWGRRGLISEAAARLKCRHCKRRGMRAVLAPAKARLGSLNQIERLLDLMEKLRRDGSVS